MHNYNQLIQEFAEDILTPTGDYLHTGIHTTLVWEMFNKFIWSRGIKRYGVEALRRPAFNKTVEAMGFPIKNWRGKRSFKGCTLKERPYYRRYSSLPYKWGSYNNSKICRVYHKHKGLPLPIKYDAIPREIRPPFLMRKSLKVKTAGKEGLLRVYQG